ncbi:MAG: benzoyl-CoA-dihydrodiol lyase [Deltaproteobacteria bacterium]|nr:benzoyl-CoA-dihydrodiol lyase [Deltaproteobacteria bacterium]
MSTIRFETEPARYRHWKLDVEGEIATLAMNVAEDAGLVRGYSLKLNSYDLGVDIELADAIQRLRFSHPRVRALVITSLRDRMFCAGANIFMLGRSSHPFKVNFCKFTNETRLYLEELARESRIGTLCALNGTASGGGYELALACEEILLVDDGASAVSLPEVALLGVLPGTGGLTRVVDKRRVRRDHADFFSTTAEGVRGQRAVDWKLVDEIAPRTRFAARVRERAAALAGASDRPVAAEGIELAPLARTETAEGVDYRHVSLSLDRARRAAMLTVRAPGAAEPADPDGFARAGAGAWAIAAWRELDDAILHLRWNEPEIGLVLLRTEGDPQAVLAVDRALARHRDHWLVREILLLQKRVLKRVDLTARTFFAMIVPGSAFAGSLFELALAADRSYMLADASGASAVALSPLNGGLLPTGSGLSRLRARFLGEDARVAALLAHEGPFDAAQALRAGLVTFAPDDIDWDDEVRLAVEERAAMSPDALTGMEASLRFVGPETLETKIFGRLSAWQNWIFTRPNSTGEKGALTVYGKAGQRPEFDWRRT